MREKTSLEICQCPESWLHPKTSTHPNIQTPHIQHCNIQFVTPATIDEANQGEMARTGIFVVVLLYFFCFCFNRYLSQISIPAKYDGFVYNDVSAQEDSIVIEAFMDPICPDSRDAWPPLKLVVDNYAPRVFLIVHPFPLPYHDNSFVACRALHIANKLNASTTYPLMESFFSHQARYYNGPTQMMSRASIVDYMSKFAAVVVGESSLSDFKDGFEDSDTDSATRISFKYGCSRGVTGTPYFFVNGFALPGAGSAFSYNQWRSIIDPLLSEKKEMTQEAIYHASD